MSRNAIDELLGRTAPSSPAPAPVPATASSAQEVQAELIEEAAEPDEYRPYILRTRPQMGFTLVEASGTLHGFMYHTLRHPKHQRRDGHEFLSFTADGLAVVMQGRGLALLFRALVRHTLAEVREFDGKAGPETVTRIDRLGVVDVRQMTDEARELLV